MRAFLAIEPGDELRAGLARVQQHLKDGLSRAGAPVRITWVRPASIHLTMKFLGEVREPLAEPLHAVMGGIIAGERPVAIPMSRLGVFPRPQEPRVLWVGPPADWDHAQDAQRLRAMQEAIESACASLGVPRDDQPWRMHLTLARIRAGERQVGRLLTAEGLIHEPVALPALAADRLTLIKSDLGPEGPVHTRLWTLNF